MPAVVRVKRRVDEEPHSAFMLNGKKRRMDHGSSIALATNENAGQTRNKEELSTVLKFAGTIKDQDNTVTTQIATRLKKSDARELVQQKTTTRRQQHQKQNLNHTERARKQQRQTQQEQRFRVVNCQRSTIGDLTEGSSDTTITQQQTTNTNGGAVSTGSSTAEITIVDIEPHMESEAAIVPTQSHSHDGPADSDTGYVYDLYLPEDEQQAAYVDMMDDNYLSVQCCDDLHFEDCYNNDSENDYDSEDSNQENYFTNDYPDEEDDMRMNDQINIVNGSDDELCSAMHGFLLDEEDDDDNDCDVPSSEDDDYDNSFVHSISVDEPSYVNDIDYCESRFGTAYARYRRRVLRSLNNEDKDGMTSDEDSDANIECQRN